jgi:hypothetical protein
MHVTLRALVVLGLVGWSSTAAAQFEPTAEQRAHARELYGQGQTHFTAHEYQQALEAFTAAFREVPNPVVLLGIASAEEPLGHRREARAALEQYLAIRTDAPDRDAVQARITALPAPYTGTLRVSVTPATAAIQIDGLTITAGDRPVAVGEHEVRVAMAGYELAERPVTIRRGRRTDLAVTLTAVAAPAAVATAPATTTAPPTETATTPTRVAPTETATSETATTTETHVTEVAPTDAGAGLSEDDVFGDTTAERPEETATTETPAPAASTSRDPSVAVWATTAIAGVALVTGTVFGFLALSKQSDFDAMPTTGIANDGEAFALVADISFAVAAVAGVTAIVLYATDQPATTSTSTASIQVVPLASPTGGGVAIGGHF